MNRYRISTSACEYVMVFNCLASSKEEAVKIFEEKVPKKTRDHHAWEGDAPEVINLDDPPHWLTQDSALLARLEDRWEDGRLFASHGI